MVKNKLTINIKILDSLEDKTKNHSFNPTAFELTDNPVGEITDEIFDSRFRHEEKKLSAPNDTTLSTNTKI